MLDVSIINAVLVITDQSGTKVAQFHNTVDFYEYEPNANLNEPARIKLTERYNDDFYLSVENVGSISGVNFVGDFDALKTQISALIETFNAGSTAAPLPIGAATEAEQQLQTTELENINTALEGGPLIPTEAGLVTYAPGVANNAQVIEGSDLNRTAFIVQVFENSAWLRFKAAATDPASREGVFLEKGQSFIFEVTNDYFKYLADLSIINAADGETFNFTFTKFAK